nr:autotransporter domain-containing protein [Pseudomonas citronellolis]
MYHNPIPNTSCSPLALAVRRHRGTGALAGVLLALLAGQAAAQSQYRQLVSFGDSYADSGYNLSALSSGDLAGYPSQGHSPAEIAPGHAYVAFPYWLQAQLGIPDAQMTNYAIGGATTQPISALGTAFSLPYELTAWNGKRFAADDLVSLSIGGNDALAPSGIVHLVANVGPDGSAFGHTEATAAAQLAASTATQTIEGFIAAGARNLVIAGFSDISAMPAAAGVPHPDSLAVYGQTYYQNLQAQLQPLAQGGTRIFLLDETRIIERMRDNLAAYGFGSFAYSGPAALPSVVQPDNVHLTSHGFEVLARYMTSAVLAPYDFALLSQTSLASAEVFTDSLLDRLDANRGLHSERPAPDGQVSVYALGTYSGRNRDDDSAASSSDYRGGSGTLGVDLQLSTNLLAGLALNYSDSRSEPDQGGHLDDEATQVAAYLSYVDGSWFGDALLGYGHHDLDLHRPGIVDPVGGSTDADTFSAALRGGYLFDLGGFSAGPLLGLEYQRSEVDGYGEGGDPLLAFNVRGQTQKSLTSLAGVQVRAPFKVGAQQFSSYLNLAWKHEFEDDSHDLDSTLQQAPLLPIHTEIRDVDSRNYGVIGGGIAVSLGDNLSAQLSASSDLGRDGGNQYQIGTALNYSF